MKKTKNKIIKRIKTFAKFPLYCILFVSARWLEGCLGGKIPVTKIQGNSNGDNEKNSILDTETDQETSDEEATGAGEDNHGYKSSSTSTDENNHVDENNNNLDENNNVVEAPSGTKKVLYIKEKKQPNIPEATPKKSNIDSKTKKANSPVKKETKASDQPVKPKQNINKEPQSITSSSPKQNKSDNQNKINPPKVYYESSNNTKNEGIAKPKQHTLVDLKEKITHLKSLKQETKKIKNIEKDIQKEIKSKDLKKLLENDVNYISKLPEKEQLEFIKSSSDLADGYITLFENYIKNNPNR